MIDRNSLKTKRNEIFFNAFYWKKYRGRVNAELIFLDVGLFDCLPKKPTSLNLSIISQIIQLRSYLNLQFLIFSCAIKNILILSYQTYIMKNTYLRKHVHLDEDNFFLTSPVPNSLFYKPSTFITALKLLLLLSCYLGTSILFQNFPECSLSPLASFFVNTKYFKHTHLTHFTETCKCDSCSNM